MAFLEGLTEADALLVVGAGALRGGNGEREALQQRSATLAARTLGLEVILVPAAPNGAAVEAGENPAAPTLRAELAEAVRGLRPRDS
jgi:hypothetical protein